ncbi:MAG: hypothetical protein WBQ25_24870 [Nitrososphaeraceae archaeon]
MQNPNDWKNVEMTGYFKVNSFTNSSRNGPAPHRAALAADEIPCEEATIPLQGRWIGIKAIFYNREDGTVKLEQWMDDGSGGPIAIFRWDNIDDMDIKFLSVMEIQPPES